MSRKKIDVSKSQLEEAVATTSSARQAAIYLNLTYPTFMRRCADAGGGGSN